MREIADQWEGGRLAAMGFTAAEVRGFVLAVFSESTLRDGVLQRITDE
jgi:hypothetical protein